jgi:uncharacterized protein
VIVLDTSGLLAAMFDDQRAHQECRAALEAAESPLLLSPFVLAELDYLVGRHAGVAVELSLLEEVATGAYTLAEFGAADVDRSRQLIDRYRDLGIGLADASLVVLADRAATHDLLTLDERHFRPMTAIDGGVFRLLPADR